MNLYTNCYCISETSPMLSRYIEEASHGRLFGVPVSLGDTEDMVITVLGQPSSISRTESGDFLYYQSTKNNCDRYVFGLTNGRVDLISKYASDLAYSQVPDRFARGDFKRVRADNALLFFRDRLAGYESGRLCGPTEVYLKPMGRA